MRREEEVQGRIWGRAEMRAYDVGASYFGVSADPALVDLSPNFFFLRLSLFYRPLQAVLCEFQATLII